MPRKRVAFRECEYCHCSFMKAKANRGYCCIQCRLFGNSNIKSNGCWEYTGGKDYDGYGIISIKDKSQKAHRISYLTFVGNIEGDLSVCHKCDNPSCINPVHLFLGTNKENMHDKIRKGRDRVIGEKNVRSIFKEEEIRTIRKLKLEGLTVTRISEIFGVPDSHICSIVSRKIWKHVT